MIARGSLGVRCPRLLNDELDPMTLFLLGGRLVGLLRASRDWRT
jgi:hypothetical protein